MVREKTPGARIADVRTREPEQVRVFHADVRQPLVDALAKIPRGSWSSQAASEKLHCPEEEGACLLRPTLALEQTQCQTASTTASRGTNAHSTIKSSNTTPSYMWLVCSR